MSEAANLLERLERLQKLADELLAVQSQSVEARRLAEEIHRAVRGAHAALRQTTEPT